MEDGPGNTNITYLYSLYPDAVLFCRLSSVLL